MAYHDPFDRYYSPMYKNQPTKDLGLFVAQVMFTFWEKHDLVFQNPR